MQTRVGMVWYGMTYFGDIYVVIFTILLTFHHQMVQTDFQVFFVIHWRTSKTKNIWLKPEFQNSWKLINQIFTFLIWLTSNIWCWEFGGQFLLYWSWFCRFGTIGDTPLLTWPWTAGDWGFGGPWGWREAGPGRGPGTGGWTLYLAGKFPFCLQLCHKNTINIFTSIIVCNHREYTKKRRTLTDFKFYWKSKRVAAILTACCNVVQCSKDCYHLKCLDAGELVLALLLLYTGL